MPYHIGEQGSYGCKGYPVVKDSDGTVMGCHDSKESAKKQLAALYVNEPEANKAASFVPPAEVRSNAKRGLELRDKYNRGGTEVGVARARDLSNGSGLSFDTIKRMNSFFARHEVDKQGEGWGKDSAGYIAWLLWGGDAGWAWAKRIINEQENREKSSMSNLTTAFFGIEKSERNADGTMTVYGKATDDSIDIDQQICDGDWLDRAMPHWFKTGGNIREQHSNIAAGVATDYEAKADGHYISALVVDPVSVKKVEAGVLKGFSIGIKNPRVTRDKSAMNGRIVDGQIVEVSLVDRPANPNCQLVLAKSASGDETVVQVEDLIEKEDKKPDYENMLPGGERSEPADKDLYNRVKAEAKEKFDVYPSAVANSWVVNEYKKRGGKYKAKTKKSLQFEDTNTGDDSMATETISVPKSIVGDILKFDKVQFEAARDALANLVQIEAGEMKEGGNEIQSISHLLEAIAHLHAWYEGEEAEGEVSAADQAELEPEEMTEEKSADKGSHIKSTVGCDCAGCTKCGKAGGCKGAMCKMHDGESMTKTNATEDSAATGAEDLIVEEKSANMDKCLECGCHKPEETHGRVDVTTADMVAPNETPKSAEADEEVTEEVTPDNSTEDNSVDLNAIVEQVVESATKALKSEIASLVAAKEAAQEKAVGLETELAQAKSLAVAGGPKRTARPLGGTSNDLVLKAATYKAKANAATDPDLAKGYKALADKYYAEATETLNK
jgi:hypothetical protein